MYTPTVPLTKTRRNIDCEIRYSVRTSANLGGFPSCSRSTIVHLSSTALQANFQNNPDLLRKQLGNTYLQQSRILRVLTRLSSWGCYKTPDPTTPNTAQVSDEPLHHIRLPSPRRTRIEKDIAAEIYWP